MLFSAIEADVEQAVAHSPLVASPNTSVMDALKLMGQRSLCCSVRQHNSIADATEVEVQRSCVLVMEQKQLLGIFTEQDIIQLSVTGEVLSDVTIAEVIRQPVVSVQQSELTDLYVPCKLLHQHRVRHLPVINDQEQMVGLLTQESLQPLLQSVEELQPVVVQEVMSRSIVSASPDSSVFTLMKLMAQHQVSSVVIVESKADETLSTPGAALKIPIGVLTNRDLIQLQALALDPEQIQASQVMNTAIFTVHPDDSLGTVRSLLQTLPIYLVSVTPVLVTGTQGELVGTLSQTAWLQALQPIQFHQQVAALKKQIAQLETENRSLRQHHTANTATREAEIQARTAEIQSQADREKLLGVIAKRIHSSLNLQATLDAIVSEVRQWLECDRVLIYQFQPDWTGVVLAESVASEWPSFLGHHLIDPCFALNWVTFYAAGRIHIVNDIFSELMTACHRDLLFSLRIRAKILLPILVGDRLWGLILVAQNRGPRCWLPEDIELIQQISTHAAIAIQQAELYHQAQLELQERQRIATALRESEALYRTTLSNISDAVLITDDQGALTFIGPNIHLLFGYTVQEVEQMTTIDALLGQALFDPHQLAVQGEIVNIEREIQDKQGSQHTVLVNVKQVQIGRGTVLYTCRDISDRQQIEKKLQASEERLRTIIETSASGSIIVDKRGAIVFANPAAAKMFGLSLEDLDEWFLGIPYHHDRNQAEGHRPSEIKLYQPSGGLRIATLQTASIVWNGQPANLISLSDITELKRAEESLRQSETKYRMLVENLPVGLLVIHGTTLRILNSNAKACELLELSIEQMQGKAALDSEWQLLREDETPMGRSEYPLHRVLATNRPLQNYVIALQRRYDPSHIWLLVNAFPIFDRNHQLQQIVMTFVDISDRRQAEINLKHSERRYASLAQAAPVGIFRTDAEGNCLYVNERWCQIANLDLKAAVGDGWQESLHPDDRDRVTTAWQTALDNHHSFQMEYRFQNAAGVVTWVYEQALAELGEEGEVIGYVGTITDITAQKQAEEMLHQLNIELEQRVTQRTAELAQANHLLTLVMDSIPQRIFWKDCHSVLLGCNHNFAKDMGSNPEALVGQRPQEWFGAATAIEQSSIEQSLEADRQVIATGEPQLHRLETVQRADQSCIWIESNKVPLRDTAGNVIGILETYEDISSRRAAEIARRESEARLQDFLDNASDLIQSVSLKSGKFLYVNRIWQETIGYTGEEAQSLNFLDIVDPKYLVDCIHFLQQFQQGHRDRVEAVELALNTKDGQQVLLEGSINVRAEHGQPAIAHAIFHDITARRAAEAALQESQYLIQRITEASPDILYIYDLQEYRNIYTNKEVFRLLGYSSEELQAMGPDLLLQLVHPEDISDVINHHVDLTEANDTDILEIEYRVRDHSNHWHWFVSRDTVFNRDENNRPKQIIGAASEITERKQIEAQLRQTNAELAHATQLKDEFLANMSHELRTPLNAILGMSEGLREDVFGMLNERQEHAIATIERSGRHLLELINDILDLAKIEAGKLEIQPAPVAVHYLCDSSLAFVKQQALQKQIRLQTEIQPNLGEITVDERRMRQVLINLLNNAVKFTPTGGSVMLKVETMGLDQTEPGSTSAPESYLAFSVIDTGIGITQKDTARLFQSFVQIDSSLNRQHTGTGLGLALVRQITEMHGGQVGVISEVGKGSHFTVYLPYTKRNSDSRLPEHPFQLASESIPPDAVQFAISPKILLVEDNEANIQTIASYLEMRGYQVVVAKDGESAIQTAKVELPNLILMDIQMPKMDGLEATRQIRLEPTLAQVPIIALTALAMPGDRDRCLAAGVTDYLPKPVRLKQVITLVQQLLSR